jgi:hypothetical protein
MNRARAGWNRRGLLFYRLSICRRGSVHDRHRQHPRLVPLRLAAGRPKQSAQIELAPSKHLVGVHAMLPRHGRHLHTRRQRRFHDPVLFFRTTLHQSRHTARNPRLRCSRCGRPIFTIYALKTLDQACHFPSLGRSYYHSPSDMLAFRSGCHLRPAHPILQVTFCNSYSHPLISPMKHRG